MTRETLESGSQAFPDSLERDRHSFLSSIAPRCSVGLPQSGAAKVMRNKRALALSLILTCLLTLPAWAQSGATARQDPVVRKPVVRKIEPPNWRVNYTPALT